MTCTIPGSEASSSYCGILSQLPLLVSSHPVYRVHKANELLVLGPLIGGFAAQAKGWRWTIWTLMIFSGAVLVMLLFLMPETNEHNILYRRSRRLRVLTKNKTIRSELDIIGGQLNFVKQVERAFIRPFQLAFTEPILLFINLYIAILNSILFSSLDSFPLVFQDIYGFNLGQSGLAYLGLFVGAAFTGPPMYWYTQYRLSRQMTEAGQIKPERRLPPAIIGSILAPISILAFGWTARESIHWIVPIASSTLFGMAIVLLMYAILNYLPDAYPSCPGAVLAGNEFFRSTASAIMPVFATTMFKTWGIHWSSTFLAGVSGVFALVPIILYHRGESIRRKSRHAQKNFE